MCAGTPPIFAIGTYRGGSKNILLPLKHGADVGIKDIRGGTAFQWAPRLHTTDAVKILLAHGADSDRVDMDGMTAPICAGRSRKYKCVELLIDSGADGKAVDNEGHGSRQYLGLGEEIVRNQ